MSKLAVMQLLVHMILILLLLRHASPSELEAPKIARRNCATHCGNVSIPYPFGIGRSNSNSNCYFDEWYEIDCIHNSTSPSLSKPFLRRTKLQVLSIDIFHQTLRVYNPVTFFSCKPKETRQPPNLTGSPFMYAHEKNWFVAVSCGLLAMVRSDHDRFVAGCTSICENNSRQDKEGYCDTGINCCRIMIPAYLTVMRTYTADDTYEAAGREERNNKTDYCNDYAFLAEQDWINGKTELGIEQKTWNFRDVKHMESVPVVLDWSFSLDNNRSLIKSYLQDFKPNDNGSYNGSRPFCYVRENATLVYNNRSRVYCRCPFGSQGNPYLLESCTDLDECKGDFNNPCPGGEDHPDVCENAVNGYICYSKKRVTRCKYDIVGVYDHLGENAHVLIPTCYTTNKTVPRSSGSGTKTILSAAGLGIGVWILHAPLLFCARSVHKILRKGQIVRREKVFFKRNGGLLLEQQLLSGEVNVDKIKLFKSKELEKSTDNFNVDRILGQGAQGAVYKGMLGDGRIVAVKKSKTVNGGEVGQFINEIVILSQINHRNVVQLLGCCLETEVPLLVYEFIPNGTLSQYIQGQIEEYPLTWEMRLRIATEIAGALAYLHAAASFPIFHRDIKSTNILLDEKYRAKVADFGISRSIAMDQTHLTTHVHGTFGYLDPEYFQSSQFTDKSDVYSFAVVLVELLTGQKPVSAVTRSEEEEYRSLAKYFLISMQEDRVFDILDTRVLKEASKTEIAVVANLARRCLNLNGRNRPTMREVTAELVAVQMSRNPIDPHHAQNYEGVDFVEDDSIGNWDVDSRSAVSLSAWEGRRTSSSLLDVPQGSFKSW